MPILDLQRRLREVGRIRIGEKGTSAGGKSIPKKLSTFRFTSRDESVIHAAAQLYGGEVRPWQAGDGSPQFEVITNAAVIPVVVPPADMAFSQYFELWSGGGCQRRCDGAWETVGEQACVCDPENRECDPHTRLSLIVPDLPVVGLFRLDTQGWNAAEELAGSVDLARSFAAMGRYLPAELRLEIREKKRPGQATKKFAVPCLDLKVQMSALTASASVDQAAMPAASGGFSPVPELPAAPGSSIAEQLDAVHAPGTGNRRANAAEPIRPTGVAPRPAREMSGATGGSGGGDAPEASGAPAGGDGSPTAAGSGPVGGIASAPVAPDDDPHAEQRARQIAMWCREELGLDDQGRHDFLAAYSQGAWSSGRQVPAGEIAGLRAAIVRTKRGELELRRRDDGMPVLFDPRFGWESTDPGAQSPARAAGPAVAEPEGSEMPAAWDEAAWVAEAADVPGIGKVKLLKQARAVAGELGLAVPASLNEVTDPGLVEALRAWLAGQRAA